MITWSDENQRCVCGHLESSHKLTGGCAGNCACPYPATQSRLTWLLKAREATWNADSKAIADVARRLGTSAEGLSKELEAGGVVAGDHWAPVWE